MQYLNEMGVFASVAELGSFTRAADKLNMPKSSVSRHVKQLEEHLGERLLNRTTRQLKLTEAGKLYFSYCKKIVEEASSAEMALSSLQMQPSGHLRVSAPLAFSGPYLQNTIFDFLKKNKQITLELLFENRMVNLVEENVDVAVRIGPLEDSSLVAKPLGKGTLCLCASPEFLAIHGYPKSLQDLKSFDVIRHPMAECELESGEIVEVESRLLVNDMGVVVSMAMGSLGIGLVPLPLAAEHMLSGQLVPLLMEYPMVQKPFYLVYPNRQVASKTLAFIEYISIRIHDQPGWDLSVIEFLKGKNKH